MHIYIYTYIYIYIMYVYRYIHIYMYQVSSFSLTEPLLDTLRGARSMPPTQIIYIYNNNIIVIIAI